MSEARVERNFPLWKKTTFRIGGPADVLVWPRTAEEVARWLRAGEVSLILGGGSNLIVSDSGVRGVTLCLEEGFSEVVIEEAGEDVIVTAQAGVPLTRLAGAVMKNSASGMEFAYGIPGSLGGALIMNAGAKDGEMKDVVDTVTIVTPEGEVKDLSRDGCGFGYRSSAFPEECVITGARLRLAKGVKEEINEKMRRYQLERKKSQPLGMPSAGSIFKNPQGDYAGRLIAAAGLKGVASGAAKVSEKHANFIVNTGRARAADVLELIRVIERKVFETFGVQLEREARIVGEFDS